MNSNNLRSSGRIASVTRETIYRMFVHATIAAAWLCGGSGCSLLRPQGTLTSLDSNVADTQSSGVNHGASSSGHKSDKATQLTSQQLDLSIHLETAELARQRGMDQEAIASYLAARRLDPQASGIAHPLAVLFDRAGKVDAAEREYETAVRETERAKRPDPAVYCDHGYFLYSTDRLDLAEKQLRKALQINPNHYQSLVNLGLVLGNQGEFEEAEQLFTKAIGPAAAKHNVGMLKLRHGDQQGARQFLQAAAQRDPSLSETRGVLTVLDSSSRLR